MVPISYLNLLEVLWKVKLWFTTICVFPIADVWLQGIWDISIQHLE